MKKIGLDLDSTLNNLIDVWVDLYNTDYNDNLKSFSNWNNHNDVKPECGMKIYDYLNILGLFYNLDIAKDARDVVEFLSKHYELYIVTAYIPETCMDKVKWVKKHLPNFNTKNIVFINKKNILNLDYLIDDGPHNIEEFNGVGIVYDRLYNRYLGDDYPRVKNWKDVEKYFIKELIREKELKEEIY